jgi:hypothetical protein
MERLNQKALDTINDIVARHTGTSRSGQIDVA